MAHLPKLNDFNEYRKNILKIQTLSGDTVMFTKEEAQIVIRG